MEYKKNLPIYLQIVDQYVTEIVNGSLKPGDRLGSIREVSLEKNVNPNTIQRAFRTMEQRGMIETRRGIGSFVIEDENEIKKIKSERLDQELDRFVERMKELGFSREDLVGLLVKGGENATGIK